MRLLKFKGVLTTYEFQVDRLPDVCPVCGNGMQPEYLGGYIVIRDYPELKRAQAVFRCPLEKCGYSFFGLYSQRYRDRLGGEVLFLSDLPLIFHVEEKKFSDIIKEITPEFPKIYNQALIAENNGLLQICGGGYRRALEFLVKDYLIKKHPDQKEEIEGMLLGPLIKEKTTDEMRIVAERAAWLGNDETHYKRIWEDKDLENLKDLIDLTVYWIEAAYKTSKYREDMQNPKRKDTKN